MAKLLTELFLILIVGWLLLETYSLFLHGIEQNRERSLNKISALHDKELKLSQALQPYTQINPKSESGYSAPSGRVDASTAWQGSLSDNFQSPSLYSSPSAISSTYSSLLKEKEEVEQERENEQKRSFWELIPQWEAIVLGALGIFGAALINAFANSCCQQSPKMLKWIWKKFKKSSDSD